MSGQGKKKYPRKCDIFMRFMVDEKERDLIYKRMEQAGIKSLRAYLLKMSVDGRVIHVELDSVREMVLLLSNATNNINQIARRVNETGSVYAADIEDIRGHYDSLWLQAKEILRRLAAV
jgi:hypothetical protein